LNDPLRDPEENFNQEMADLADSDESEDGKIKLNLVQAELCSPQTNEKDTPDPSNAEILAFGSLMSIPSYFSTVIMHEGSHALMGKAFGAKIVGFKILPFKQNGSMRFGKTTIEGKFNRSEEAMIYTAPKVANFIILMGYSNRVETDSLPQNKYGQTALATFAAASLIDFTKDVFDTRENSDLSKVYSNLDFSTSEEYSFRAFHGALAAFFSYEVGKGIYQIFDCPKKNENTSDFVCGVSPDALEFGILKKF
ncbi:MAG: hypothetical protein HYY61_02530, partial [Deltaproteobacteria bacterium]|nr:hypothetical protein [Deltaproteobacteria bacterium]